MKKLLTILMAVACLLAVPTVNVFAEETELDENATSGSVLLTATQASTYVVKLPVSIDVSSGSGTIVAKVKGDVDSAYKVTIKEQDNAENKLVDKADSNNKVTITVTPGNAINGSVVTAAYNDNAKTEIGIEHAGLTAGSYEYQFPIVISLDKITQ